MLNRNNVFRIAKLIFFACHVFQYLKTIGRYFKTNGTGTWLGLEFGLGLVKSHSHKRRHLCRSNVHFQIVGPSHLGQAATGNPNLEAAS